MFEALEKKKLSILDNVLKNGVIRKSNNFIALALNGGYKRTQEEASEDSWAHAAVLWYPDKEDSSVREFEAPLRLRSGATT